MKRICISLFFSFFVLFSLSSTERTETDRRLDIIRFGTETEINALIQTVRNEGINLLDTRLETELVTLFQSTRNTSILTGLLGFFASEEKKGLEDRAIRIVAGRDEEANATVLGALDYLGRVNATQATEVIMGLLDTDEERFLDSGFRALGRVARNSDVKDQVADYIIDFYENRNYPDQNRRTMIVALGETGSKIGIELLSSIAENNDDRPSIRMAALEALSKIGDNSGLSPLIRAVNAPDPNVRSTAIVSLAPFSGKEVEDAILEGFRDSFFRSRLGAARASGERKMSSAIPYLQFRAENDDVPTVRDEAIRALGEIGTSESKSVLEALFNERKNPSRVRILAAEMLIAGDPENYAERVIEEMDEARRLRQTPLYNGFLRAISLAKTQKVEGLVKRFLDSGDVIEKSFALDMTLNNEFRSFAPEIRLLLNGRNAALSRKAEATLEKLGLARS